MSKANYEPEKAGDGNRKRQKTFNSAFILYYSYRFQQIILYVIGVYIFLDFPKNTLVLSVYSFVVSFPLPIIISLMLNQFTRERMKKFIQTVIYAPHFISVIVIVVMIFLFTTPKTGIIN